MLKFEKGDIVTGNYPIFCHQVNCKGKMGAGLAKQIKNKYPIVASDFTWDYLNGFNKLGTNIYSCIEEGRFCVSMYAQDGYGRDKRYTDYDAFKSCLNKIADLLHKNNVDKKMTIAFPYGIGCGLAGGDWYIILGMLKDFAEKIPQDVIIVEKE